MKKAKREKRKNRAAKRDRLNMSSKQRKAAKKLEK